MTDNLLPLQKFYNPACNLIKTGHFKVLLTLLIRALTNVNCSDIHLSTSHHKKWFAVWSMSKYLMENEEESLRLEMKTENRITEQQAKWAGLKPGMRVADIGCGTGKTTAHLHHMVQPSGEAVGIDSSQERNKYAKENYGHIGPRFSCHDIFAPRSEEHTSELQSR